MFCSYQTSHAGKCGKNCEGERCDRHKGLKDREKKVRQPKFRGDSKFQSEMGMYNNKGE